MTPKRYALLVQGHGGPWRFDGDRHDRPGELLTLGEAIKRAQRAEGLGCTVGTSAIVVNVHTGSVFAANGRLLNGDLQLISGIALTAER